MQLGVTYFRPRRTGPESDLEEAVAEHVARLFPSDEHLVWVAGSLPLGAGLPDLLVVTCKKEVCALAASDLKAAEILAYLRVVRCAKMSTIAYRATGPRQALTRSLDRLVEAHAIFESNGAFALNPSWRDILLDVAAIEAKVSKWQDAVSQAARNRLFAHRSYVALPRSVTRRVRAEPIFAKLGVGLLSACENGGVRVSRRPRRRLPRVWEYYYKLALILANSHRR